MCGRAAPHEGHYTKTLLQYRADIASRGFARPPTGGDATAGEGPTLLDLAAEDPPLLAILQAFGTGRQIADVPPPTAPSYQI